MKFDVILLGGATRMRCESDCLNSEELLLIAQRDGRLCPKGLGAVPYHAIAYIQEVDEDGS